MHRHTVQVAALATALPLQFTAGATFAQQAEAAIITGSTGFNAEEIVVTARKREESLQEVPLSISAFSAEQLEQVGASNNEDVALLTPNFNTVRQIGRRLDRPTIRGQSAAAVGGEPNASYFIDGVAVAGSIATLTLGPVERVEILRGPQSAQFGRATFAGAINYVTRRPSNEFTGEVKAKYGTQDTRQLAAWASGPIVPDRLLYFVSAGYDRFGGDWRNSLKANQAPNGTGDFIANPVLPGSPPQFGDNSRLGGTETKDGVVKLMFMPTDSSELTFKFGYTKGEDDHYVQLLQEPGELNCFLPTDGRPGTEDNRNEVWYTTSQGQFCGTLDPDRVTYAANNPFNPDHPSFDYANYFRFGVVNGVNALVDGLPAQGGRRQARVNLPDIYTGMSLRDFSGFFPGTTPEDWYATPERPGTFREQQRYLLEYQQDLSEWSSTMRLAYNDDEFEQGLDLDRTEQRYLAGLFTNFAINQTRDYAFEWRVDSPADNRLRGSAGVYYFDKEVRSSTKRFVGLLGLGQLEPPLQRDTRNSAVFGALEYSLSDRWTLSGEARFARDEKTIVGAITCEDSNDPNFGREARDKAVTESLTPRVTLRFQPSDDTMLYALVAKGNKPAEFNDVFFRVATADGCETAEAIDKGATRIKEEKAWTYELGGKTIWLDGRLLTNLSLFYIDWTDQSVFQTVELSQAPVQITGNAGKSEIYGAELETSYLFTDNLTGRFSYGLADGKYVEYNDPEYASTTGIGLGDDNANNVEGHRLPSSPKHSFIFALDYVRTTTLNLVGGDTRVDFFARSDFVLETDRYSSATNFVKFPNRKVWNFRAGLEQDRWKLTGYVTNILDDQTPTAIFGFEVIGAAQNINWENDPNPNNSTAPNMNSIAPPPGRLYGVELLYRFGN